jgi:chromosome partitioning protein
MKVWTITSQKGGVGKTVLATNLSVEAIRQGEKVLLIDLDPQGSATKWWEARTEETPLFIKSGYDNLASNIAKAEQNGFSLVIIDTAGRESLRYTEAIEKATFCIVPCQPSKDDIRSALITVDLLKAKNKHFCFVVTRCPSVGSDKDEAQATLSTIGLVCDTATMERKCYKRAYGADKAVVEFDPSDKGADEISGIYQWIKAKEARLNG